MSGFVRRPATPDELMAGGEAFTVCHPSGREAVCRMGRWGHPEVTVYTYYIFVRDPSGEAWELVWQGDFEDHGPRGRHSMPSAIRFNDDGTAILVVLENGTEEEVPI